MAGERPRTEPDAGHVPALRRGAGQTISADGGRSAEDASGGANGGRALAKEMAGREQEYGVSQWPGEEMMHVLHVPFLGP
jgi:hypothetical protein